MPEPWDNVEHFLSLSQPQQTQNHNIIPSSLSHQSPLNNINVKINIFEPPYMLANYSVPLLTRNEEKKRRKSQI